MTTGEGLYQLQELDTEADAKRDRLMEIDSALKDDRALRQARQTWERQEKHAREWQARQCDLELEIESLAEKTSRSEDRLYGGSVTNPKELADLQAEIASLKRRREKLEDELLEAMIQREAAEDARDEARAHLEETESLWAARQEALVAERQALEERFEQMTARRGEVTARLDSALLAKYERLRSTRGGRAVARVRDDICTVCGVSISSSAEWKLREGKLIDCDACGRIIVPI